jgi:hypothetical protein
MAELVELFNKGIVLLLLAVRMGKELLKKDVSKAFSEVKATSRAHDKKVALNTSRNYNALQASKPWASAEEVSAFNRGRGAPRGRGNRNRGGYRPGNEWTPRNDNFNSGGGNFGFNQQGQNFPNRGNFSQGQRGQRGGQNLGNNRASNNGNRNPGFPKKTTGNQNRGARGGAN